MKYLKTQLENLGKLNLGFGKAKIRRVLTQKYEKHNNNYYIFNDFVQALLDVLEP